MSTSGFIATLNRRNRVALCATLVCVGLILLQGGGIRLAIGIAFLGVAYSWALGTDRRIVHWLFFVCGLLLLTTAVLDGYAWRKNKPGFIKNQMIILDSERYIAQSEPDVKEIGKDYDELSKTQQELRELQAEGALRHVMKNDWGAVAAGLLLFGSGIGLLVGIKHGAHSDELPDLKKQVREHIN